MGFVLAFAYLFYSSHVQMPMEDNILFVAAAPICGLLANIFFPGQDPMAALFFILPVMLILPTAAGMIFGLTYSILRDRAKTDNGK